MKPEHTEALLARGEIVVGNPKFRRFVEEERARVLWEQEHKEKRPIDKRRAIAEGLLLTSLIWNAVLTYALAMEVWERRNEMQTAWSNNDNTLVQFENLRNEVLHIKK